MHILLVHQFFLDSKGVGGTRFNVMVKHWLEKGHTVTVISGGINYMSKERLDSNLSQEFESFKSFKLHRCSLSKPYGDSFVSRIRNYFGFAIKSTFAGLFKIKGKFDVVVVTSPPLFVGISGYFISRVKRIPLVTEVRDLWPRSAIELGVLRGKTIIKFAKWFERFLYKKSEKIVVLTPAFKEELATKTKIKEDKICFLPNGADQILPANKEFKYLGEEKVKFVYAGAIGLANDLSGFIDLFKKLDPVKYSLNIVGDGGAFTEVEESVKGFSNIELQKSLPKEQVLELIKKSDVGVSCMKNLSVFDTIYNNKTFDYLGLGVPVISNLGGVSKKLLEENNCGITYKSGDLDSFIEAVQKLTFVDCRKTLGVNGINLVTQKFDRIKIAEDYMNLLESIVNR